MNTDGGYAEYIRIPATWAVKKPLELSSFETMALGTAGITAATALYKMELMRSKSRSRANSRLPPQPAA